MVGAQRLLADGERSLVERLGFGVAALGREEYGQVVEHHAHVGVIGAQRLLADAEGAPVERLRVGVAALLAMQPGQVVERGAQPRMGGA